jgi:hypothetical protein
MWQNILTTSHSYDWKAFPVGEKSAKGALVYFPASGDPLSQSVQGLKSYIRYAQEDRNAWHVDIVGHSGGGVVARSYIGGSMPQWYPDGRPQVSHLVMLGTPNLGTRCAMSEASVRDDAKDQGETSGFFRQLFPEAMQAFNQRFPSSNGVKFSALGGKSDLTACGYIGKNDGKVSLESAHWTVADKGETESDHEELTSVKEFSDFVKKRLAIGPRGDFTPALPKGT